MANTKVSGDLIQDGSILQSHLNENHGITTDHIGEGTNKFFTDARVASYLDSNNYATQSYVTTHLTTNSYATQTYVDTAVANLVAAAPTTLDTLNELAAALGDDPNFATTVTTSIGTKWTQDNTKISNWDTAFGWGNHASAGYLTSHPTIAAASSVNNTNNTVIQDITLDSNGHITSLTSLNLNDSYYTEAEIDNKLTNGTVNYISSNAKVGSSINFFQNDGGGNLGIRFNAGPNPEYSIEDGSAWEFEFANDAASGDFRIYYDGSISAANEAISWTESFRLDGGESNAYVWGNRVWHAGDFSSTNISNWNTAYSWGNHASAGYLTSTITNNSGITIRTSTNGAGAKINFSDHASGSYAQNGTVTYVHSDGGSYGSGNAFIFSSTESTMTFLADGKLMYKEGIYSKPASGTGAGTRKDTNWDTAYGWGNHASAGYLTSYSETDTLATVTARGATTNSSISVNGDITVLGNQVITAGVAADVKFSVWAGTTYGIGMTPSVTLGGLNDYAMTFCMNNDTDRGFWWGYSGQSKASGAMSLTTAGHLTVTSRVDAPIFYDSNDTNSYFDGSGSGSLVIRGSSPTVYFRDTNHNSAMLHCNSHLLYVLRGNTDTTAWTQVNGQWPATWNLTNNLYSGGGAATFVGDVTANTSDRRLKENIKNIPNAIDKVKSINGVTFDWKDDLEEINYTRLRIHDVGVIAQEIQDVLPEAVRPAPFDTDEEGNSRSGDNYLTVQYEKIVPLLIEAIKEQQQQIEELKQLINK